MLSYRPKAIVLSSVTFVIWITVQWRSYCDPKNLRAMCQRCHNCYEFPSDTDACLRCGRTGKAKYRVVGRVGRGARRDCPAQSDRCVHRRAMRVGDEALNIKRRFIIPHFRIDTNRVCGVMLPSDRASRFLAPAEPRAARAEAGQCPQAPAPISGQPKRASVQYGKARQGKARQGEVRQGTAKSLSQSNAMR